MVRQFSRHRRSASTAWATAQRFVAKGLAWIYAKLTGMNATEMVRIVDEQYNADPKSRDKAFADGNAQLKKRQDDAIAKNEIVESGVTNIGEFYGS